MKAFADKSAFSSMSGGRRRYKEFDCPGVGRVVLRSITAGEFARVDAARTRAAIACRDPKQSGNQVRSLNDGLVELLVACVCDGEKNPMFSLEDRVMLIGLDTAVSDALVSACIEHCQLDETHVEDLQKNS